MSPFWRRKPLHQKLAEEGGLILRPEPVETRPPFEAGIHGLARPREWDAVVAVAAELSGDAARFVALPDGSLLVEDGPEDVRQLADAVDGQLAPPYRAEAVRRDDGLWAVAANQIEVVQLEEDLGGDEIELAVQGDLRTLLVDDQKVFGSAPALEALARARHGDAFVVRAVRLDGHLWELRTAAL